MRAKDVPGTPLSMLEVNMKARLFRICASVAAVVALAILLEAGRKIPH